jgi:hypothetical protein
MAGNEFSYEIYINCMQDVCIVGRIENDEINSLSFSTVSDLKRTQSIIEEIANGASASASTAGSEYDEIKRNWYKLNLAQTITSEKILYHLSENPGGYFDRSFLSEQINQIFGLLVKTAEARLADGAYLPVLLHYHELLKNDKGGVGQALGDTKIKYLAGIIKSESYLKLSRDSDVRELYQSISECVIDVSDGVLFSEIESAEARLANGAYLPVLHSYQALLSKFNRDDQQAVEYYHQMEPLIAIVESENYLYSSTDSASRDLYKSLAKSASELYAAHMATRG